MKVLHLSDLHIGKSNNGTRTRMLLEGIDDLYGNDAEKPLIIITGDIVNDARKIQYREAQYIIDEYRNKGYCFLIAPGNHDYGWMGFIAKRKNIQRFGKYLSQDIDFPTVTQIGNCHFIGLDSMEGELEPIENLGSEGEIGQEQLLELDALLDETRTKYPNDKIFVYFHHHPFYWDYNLSLKDSDKFQEIIKPRLDGNGNKIPRLEGLLFGHKHLEKRFGGREATYLIKVILESKATTEIEKGTLPGTTGKPVFRFNEIDVGTWTVTPKEVVVR